MSNLTLDPQPLEPGYFKRNGIPALKLFAKNSGLFVVVAALIAIINYCSVEYLNLPISLLTIGFEVLFVMSVCFLAEHKRSAFDFFTKDSLKFCTNLLLHTNLFKVYFVMVLFVCAGSWIVDFFSSPATEDTTSNDSSTWWTSIITILFLVAILVSWAIITTALSLYVLKFFIVLQYNLAQQFFDAKVDIDDHTGITAVSVYALHGIKENKIATIKAGFAYGIFWFCSLMFISFDSVLLEKLVSSTISHLITILFVLYTYQLHREIMLGKRKVKQEETESNIDAVPEAS